MMIRITYTSAATQAITPSMILDILEAARDFNGNRGVSGLLYCAQNQFAQVLEGEAEAVDTIFEKIKTDARHKNITVKREDITERAFQDWRMAFVDSSTAEVARVLIGHGLDSYEPQKWPMERTSQLLASFANALRAERIPVRY